MKATKLVIGASLLIAFAAAAPVASAEGGVVESCEDQITVPVIGEGDTFAECAVNYTTENCRDFLPEQHEAFRECMLGS